MACHNTIKTLPIKCYSMSLRKKSGCLNIKRSGMRLSHSYLTEPITREGKYVHGKLKTWKERMNTNFHGQGVPYDMYCNATAVLKIDTVYKQGKNHHPQAYVQECRYTDAEIQQCNMLSDNDDDFCNLPGVTKLIMKLTRRLC